MIELREYVDNDLTTFTYWLKKPHVAKWYKEPEEWIYELEHHNDEFHWVHQFIVEVEGKPIGFCQYYEYSLGGETWHGNADVEGAYSIDYMIGEEQYLRKGLGTKIVNALDEMIREKQHATKIIVQPEPENLVSRKTLLSAGYSYDKTNDIFYKKM